MMTEETNVGPLATPTRFLYENGQWNLTPSLTNEVNPFECHFPSPHAVTKERKWSPQPMSPKEELLNSSPSTPPMSMSQSPTNSSISLTISPRNSMADIQEKIPAVPRRTTRTTRKKAKIEEEYKPKTGHAGRKRCIVFEGEDAEERRKKFLERNRVAAYKCRQKKKTWMQELEQRAEMSSSRNEELRQTVSQLKEESMYLRNLLLSHGNCECESVQAYLRQTSEQITNNVHSRRNSSLIPPNNYYNSSTGLTPFLNTVINKTEPENMEANDYFSHINMA